MVTEAMKLKDACFFEEKLQRQHIKKQRHYLLTKIRLVKVMVFPVVKYECELERKLSAEELMLLNCGVVEDS